MKSIDIALVNRLSPYTVWTSTGRDFFFITDAGNLFVVSFVDDPSIWETSCYQLIITNGSDSPSHNDPKLRETILQIISGFFASNSGILLYICDSEDGKQAIRNRLFMKWFALYKEREKYRLCTTEMVYRKGVPYYAAIIVQSSNPQIDEILAEFNRVIGLLKSKPLQ